MEVLRECRKCGIKAYTEAELETHQFIKSRASKYGHRELCYPCRPTDNQLPSVKKSKHRIQLGKRYHCTPEEYDVRMASSNVCGVCGSTSNLCYDHDHNTMKFRGVLCRGCNASIGQLGDTLEALKQAVSYLESHYDTH